MIRFAVLLFALILPLGLSGCQTLDEVDRGMPEQVRLYRSPGYVPLGNRDQNEYGPHRVNCTGGQRLRGWC